MRFRAVRAVPSRYVISGSVRVPLGEAHALLRQGWIKLREVELSWAKLG